ncbi:hypothetical protein ACNVED_11135 [Legionella sp. D16C41]|uniref:hypothetical protein n=1 Tax=Legionella sp. D16C41 TaxID=3402688 RepID=UPI003AF5A301
MKKNYEVSEIGLPQKEVRHLQIDYLQSFLDCFTNIKRLNECYRSRNQGSSELVNINVIKFCQESFDENGKYRGKEGNEKDPHDLDSARFSNFYGNPASNNSAQQDDPRDQLLCDRDRFLLDMIHFHLSTDYTERLVGQVMREIEDIRNIPDKDEQNKRLAQCKKTWSPLISGKISKSTIDDANLDAFGAFWGGVIVTEYLETFLFKPLFNHLLPLSDNLPKEPINLFKIKGNQKNDRWWLESELIQTTWRHLILNLQSKDDEREINQLREENDKLKKDNAALQNMSLGGKIGFGFGFTASVGLGAAIGALLGTVIIPIPGVGTTVGAILGGLVVGGGVATAGSAGAGIFNFATGNPNNGLAFTTLGFASAGAVGGAFLGTFLIPIPIVGTAVGAAAGALVGALVPLIAAGIKHLYNKYQEHSRKEAGSNEPKKPLGVDEIENDSVNFLVEGLGVQPKSSEKEPKERRALSSSLPIDITSKKLADYRDDNIVSYKPPSV